MPISSSLGLLLARPINWRWPPACQWALGAASSSRPFADFRAVLALRPSPKRGELAPRPQLAPLGSALSESRPRGPRRCAKILLRQRTLRLAVQCAARARHAHAQACPGYQNGLLWICRPLPLGASDSGPSPPAARGPAAARPRLPAQPRMLQFGPPAHVTNTEGRARLKSQPRLSEVPRPTGAVPDGLQVSILAIDVTLPLALVTHTGSGTGPARPPAGWPLYSPACLFWDDAG